ncbi:hypothetical protein Vretimale_12894 [Volvox reticuliferus]|uniref:Uncharacterized protein n=1 Tax=Volvox reticuliferus TaxID=1737510 RepID=A0A8J4GL89_9CHLO|nr:hypothetical protein Vretifemale_9268 [Volvox reticuliferus]GIM09009.1 hypothetical protein Vretimale_12894 [Volvox reticuliferus]
MALKSKDLFNNTQNVFMQLGVMDDSGTGVLPQAWEDSSHWISKAFLDILRQNIIPNLVHFYATAHDEEDAHTSSGLSWKGTHDLRPEERTAREVQAAITLVCADWSATQRQVEQEVVQVRLWEGGHVRSLESYLRRQSRIKTLRLQSPQPDVTDAPGMVAAVSDLLYGSAAGPAGAIGGPGDVRSDGATNAGEVRGCGGGEGGPAALSAGDSSSFGGSNSGARCSQGDNVTTGVGSCATQISNDVTQIGSALPLSLRCLEADGPTAVPLLLLAAAELPHLEALSISQLPAAWTYEEGALPWPPHAEARLRTLVPREVVDQASDSALHVLMYGTAVYRRFRSYWLSYDGALAALILHRGRQLRELSLEAPARSVGLRVMDMLASQGPSRLEALRLWGFGLRREPCQTPRLPLERAGLRLDAALKSLASMSTTLLQQQQQQQQYHTYSHNHNQLHEQPWKQRQALPHPVRQQPRISDGGQGERSRTTPVCTKGVDLLGSDGGRGLGGSSTSSSSSSGTSRQQRGISSAFLCTEDALLPDSDGRDHGSVRDGGGRSRVGGGCDYCGLTRLELLSCGLEPLHAEALEGLRGLQVLSLRGSCITWRARLPNLRHLSRLRSLDLRRCSWFTERGTSWDEQLLLPPSLEALDLIGFTSLTTAELGSLERLTALAELSDITLHPGPADRSAQQLLQPPYTGLAALTCMDTIRLYVGKARMRRNDGYNRLTSLLEEDESDDDDDASGGSEGSSSEDSVRHGTATGRRSRCASYGEGKQGGCGAVGSSNSSERQSVYRVGGGPAGSVVVQSTPPLAAVSTVMEPPLVSLTLYGVLPQDISDLFHLLPLLTRLVFGDGKEEDHGDDTKEEDDSEGVGEFVMLVGELPRLRELELREGLLGYGRLALGPATSLTRLVVDDVEYVDVRYIELPPFLQHLSLTAWFGLPELYHLAEGPVLSTALARAAMDRLGRAAKAMKDPERIETPTAFMHLEDAPPRDLTRALEAEVERQFVQRLLPPLRQLRVLQLNWDVVTHGPFVTHGSQRPAAAAAATSRDVGGASGGPSCGHGGGSGGSGGSGGGANGSGGGGSGTATRWRFPQLPLLEELNIPWMQELPNEDLRRLMVSCPALRGVTHGNGSRRAVRDAEGSWIRRSGGATGEE